MRDILKNYIDGAWVVPSSGSTQDIINPATGKVSGRLALSAVEDVERAVTAARRAFEDYSVTEVEDRASILNRIADLHEARAEDMAQAVTLDIGMPIAFAWMTVGAGAGQFRFLAKAIVDYPFVVSQGRSRIRPRPAQS